MTEKRTPGQTEAPKTMLNTLPNTMQGTHQEGDRRSAHGQPVNIIAFARGLLRDGRRLTMRRLERTEKPPRQKERTRGPRGPKVTPGTEHTQW